MPDIEFTNAGRKQLAELDRMRTAQRQIALTAAILGPPEPEPPATPLAVHAVTLCIALVAGGYALARWLRR